MKNLYMLLIVCVAILLIPNYVQAQEDENEVKIKLVKEKDGDQTVLDTTIIISGNEIENLEEVKELLKDAGFDDFDILIDDLGEANVKAMHLDGKEDGFEKIVIIKHKKGESDEGEKKIIVTIIKTDSVVDGKVVEMHVGESGYGYFISDDDDMHEIKSGEGEYKVIMHKHIDGDENIFVGDDDLHWVGEGQCKIEVIEGENGKKVIVENEDGTKREYDLEEGKGTYIIGEDGELKKIENDVVWVDGNETSSRISIHVDDDNETLIISEDGETIELKDIDAKHSVFFIDSEMEEGEHEVFVEVIEKKEGNKTVRIKTKIILKSISEEDIKMLEKSGVSLKTDDMEKLELEHLMFHPNPSDGKFTLEFSTPEKGTTEVMIFDSNGKKVYREKIKNFDGHYKNDIDISSEKNGVYFLKVTQGDKMSSRKIILD